MSVGANRADRNAPDGFPACPACGDLCGKLATRCAGCGAALYPTKFDFDAFVRVGSRAMREQRRAAQLREDVQTRKGKAV